MANELSEPFERMLERLFPPSRTRAIDAGGGWSEERDEIERSGFLDALVSKADGGAGLSFKEVAPLFAALGRHAAPLAIGVAMIERASRDDNERVNAASLLHAAAIAGAAGRVLAMTVAHANERVQFGKPVGRQQAVQQQLAIMAEETVAVRLAVEFAANAGWPDMQRTALAKTVASDAAPRISAVAHAVHGAIGIGAEHDLQLYTRRLHAWWIAEGSENLWARRLGADLIASGERPVDYLRMVLFGES